MSLSSDSILDRIKLKAAVNKWRNISIAAFLILLFVLSFKLGNNTTNSDFIARVKIEGLIVEDLKRSEKIKSLSENQNIKAVILYINSPGGTLVGGESLFKDIRKLAEKKPVVAVMGSMATSGGYMVALGADYISSYEGTITGSIGVLLQTADVTELSDKIGVNFSTFKSGELKGAPSPFEKITPKVKDALEESIKNSYNIFVDMVSSRRGFKKNQALELADGRIYIGTEALKKGLIDSTDGMDGALNWLHTEKAIDKKLSIRDISVKDKKMNFLESLTSVVLKNEGESLFGRFNSGLMAIWKPNI